MERQFYFIGIAFFGMINGMFHPLRVEAYHRHQLFHVAARCSAARA